MFNIANAEAALLAFTEARHGNVVTAQEVLDRVNVCLACPMRRKIRLHPTDQASRLLGLRANKNRVPNSLTEFKCGVCHCSLMLLIPAKPEHLHRDSPEEAKIRASKAPQCWLPKAVATTGA